MYGRDVWSNFMARAVLIIPKARAVLINFKARAVLIKDVHTCNSLV